MGFDRIRKRPWTATIADELKALAVCCQIKLCIRSRFWLQLELHAIEPIGEFSHPET